MVDKVLFEHEAPLFDDVEQGTLHVTAIHLHPPEEHTHRHQTLHLLVELLVPTVWQQTGFSHVIKLNQTQILISTVL